MDAVADPETSQRGGGARNMKHKPLHSAAIFFGLFFTRQGGMPPLTPPPPDPLLGREPPRELCITKSTRGRLSEEENGVEKGMLCYVVL